MVRVTTTTYTSLGPGVSFWYFSLDQFVLHINFFLISEKLVQIYYTWKGNRSGYFFGVFRPGDAVNYPFDCKNWPNFVSNQHPSGDLWVKHRKRSRSCSQRAFSPLGRMVWYDGMVWESIVAVDREVRIDHFRYFYLRSSGKTTTRMVSLHSSIYSK